MKFFRWLKNRFLRIDYSKEYYKTELFLSKGRENYWREQFYNMREKVKNI